MLFGDDSVDGSMTVVIGRVAAPTVAFSPELLLEVAP